MENVIYNQASQMYIDTIRSIKEEYKETIKKMDEIIKEASLKKEFYVSFTKNNFPTIEEDAKYLKMYYIAMGFNVDYYIADVKGSTLVIKWK